MRRLLRLLRETLARRWTPLILALIAMGLAAPSLDYGWQLDDYVHRMLLGLDFEVNGETVTLDLFRYADDSPEQRKELMDYGTLPWWTSPDWKAAFWRPIAAFTHWVDYEFWPATAELMHAHSILWFGILVLVVARLYRRIDGTAWIAGLAAVLFAIDDAHATAVGWLANRNVIIATLFGASALIAHARWRHHSWQPGKFVGPAFFALALLSKESGIAVMAYLFSYALFIDRASWRSRVLSVAPYVMIVLVWRVLYQYLGYGVAGMDLYADPLVEPVRFAGQAVFRIPILLLAQWAFPPADLTVFMSDDAVIKLTIVAVIVLALLLLALMPVLRRERVARFWGLGMVLAVIPCAITAPSDRLLFFVGIGAMGLLARFLSFVFVDRTESLAGRWRRFGLYSAAVVMVVTHLLAPLAMFPMRANQPMGAPEVANRLYFTPAPDADLAGKVVVMVNAPSILHATESWSRALTENLPTYDRLRVLATGLSAVNIYRPDQSSLILKPEDGFLAGLFDSLYRSGSRPVSDGEMMEISGMSVEITSATDNGRPLEVRFTFSEPLDDPSYHWLQFTEGGFQQFVPPAVGDSTTVPRILRLF